MMKYLPHILIISFVFLLVPTAQAASYEDKKRIEDAKEEVRKNPDDADAHLNLGAAYQMTGVGHYKAIKSYKRATRIDPDYAKAIFLLGIGYYYVGDISSALDQYKTLKKLDTKLADGLWNLIEDAL
jgi:tetratricopeptide (TPR) repeat protein